MILAHKIFANEKTARFLFLSALFIISEIILPNVAFSIDSDSEDEVYSTSRPYFSSSETGVSSDNESEEKTSRLWTITLLDRSRVELEGLDKSLKEPFWPFITPRVQEKYLEKSDKKEEPYLEFKDIDVEGEFCWICKLNLPDTGNPLEELVNNLMGQKAKKKSGNDLEKEISRFSAALAFFPIKEDPDKFLVYLFGRWLSLLNVDAVVKNFGLRAAVTKDLFGGTGDQARRLSAVESEDVRVTDIMNAHIHSRKGLYPLDSFKLVAGESRIEAIRFKPKEDEWGRSYITGSDLLNFRMIILGTTPLLALRVRALKFFERFCDRTKDCIYEGFLPYISIPVDKDLSDELTSHLVLNWAKYFHSVLEEEEIVYPHWTYWFRMRNITDKSGIYAFRGQVDFKGNEIIDITGFGKVKVLNLIRTRPIRVDGKFYWFDRGEWFEISETTVKLMRSELEREGEKLDYRALELPSYDEESIKRKKSKPRTGEEDAEGEEDKTSGSGDYEEQAYNKAVFQHLKTRFPRSEVSLLDRTDTYMSSKRDKFEFADIFFKDANGIYYLVHVKRAKSNQLGHVCTQAERSAMYLSGHLDRSALEYAFMSAELNMLEGVTFLGKGISFPWIKGITVDTVDGFKENLKTKVLIPEDKSKLKVKSAKNPIYKVLENFIEGKDFDAEFWRLHPISLLKLFEKISMLDLDEEGLINKVHDAAKEGVRKSLFFSKETTLSTKKRSKIKIVIAIVDDGDSEFVLKDGDEAEKTNKTVRLHQARQVIRHRHFDFGWTIIPKKSAVLPRTLEEYPYKPEDLDNLLQINFPINNTGNLGRFPTVDLGTKKKPLRVTVYKPKSKKGRKPRKFIVPPYSKSMHGGSVKTPESFLAQVIKNAYDEGHIENVSEGYFPFEPLPKVWVLVKLVLPTEESEEVSPVIIHGNYYNIKKLKDKSEAFIRSLGKLKNFRELRKVETSKKPMPPKKKPKKPSTPPPLTMGKIEFAPDLSWSLEADSGPAIFQHMVLLLDGDKKDSGGDYSVIRRSHFDLLIYKKKNFVKPFELKNDRVVLREGVLLDLQPGSVFAGFRDGSAPPPKLSGGGKVRKSLTGASVPASFPDDAGSVTRGAGYPSLENVKSFYENSSGFLAIDQGEVKKDREGKEYIKVLLDGSSGDCCFHAMGVSRQKMIEKLSAYIGEMAPKLIRPEQRKEVVANFQQCIGPLNALISTAQGKDSDRLKKYEISAWKDRIISLTSPSSSADFDQIIAEQAKESSFINWSIVEEYAKKILGHLNKGPYLEYLEFEQAFVADIWKKIGDDTLTSALKRYFIKIGVIDEEENMLKMPTTDELDILVALVGEERLPKKSKKYMEDFFKLQDASTDANSMNVILRDFYITNREWLDPSAVIILSQKLGLKVRLYQERDSVLEIIAQSQLLDDDKSPWRNIFYNGTNHYDLLHPLRETR